MMHFIAICVRDVFDYSFFWSRKAAPTGTPIVNHSPESYGNIELCLFKLCPNDALTVTVLSNSFGSLQHQTQTHCIHQIHSCDRITIRPEYVAHDLSGKPSMQVHVST